WKLSEKWTQYLVSSHIAHFFTVSIAQEQVMTNQMKPHSISISIILTGYKTPTESKHFPLALAFSLDEVNRNPDLLPNMSLVFEFSEGCCKTVSELYSLMPLFKENQDFLPNYNCNEETTCIVVLTGPNWETSTMFGTFLDPYRSQQILQLTYGPFHPILSDHEKFPYLYQMSPKDTALPLAMVSLMLHFNWNWIGLVISDNDQDVDKCVRCPEDQYANREQHQCIHKAVIFLNYEDPLGMTLALMALWLSAFTVLVLGIFVKHHDTPLVKANNRNLSYILLISLIFCFLCPLLFIGHPNSATCILQQITFGVVFTLAISTVLTKTVTVLLAFIVTAPGRRMRYFLVSGAPNYIIAVCTFIQIILCAIWLRVSPPFTDTDAHSEYGQIIIVCNKGSDTAFYCVLGYHGSLALGSFIVAFLARNLPDKFNEAKFLTFSMLLFCSVWVTFIPVYHSTKGKVMVVVEVFSILVSSAGLLGCIFIPKCYIILFRPERNSLEKIREKTSS
ncbi:hypothetical protein STEG23_038380, partial [Scotinomys teguina]